MDVLHPQSPPRSSRLNPNAPIFVPMRSYQTVEDFSDQWWDLVHSSPCFRDYWLQDCFDDVDVDGDCQIDEFDLPDFDDAFDLHLPKGEVQNHSSNWCYLCFDFYCSYHFTLIDWSFSFFWHFCVFWNFCRRTESGGGGEEGADFNGGVEVEWIWRKNSWSAEILRESAQGHEECESESKDNSPTALGWLGGWLGFDK